MATDYARALRRLTSIGQADLFRILLAARDNVESLIERRARSGALSGGNKQRDAVYLEIRQMYGELNSKLAQGTSKSIRRNAKFWHNEVRGAVTGRGDSAGAMLSWTRFDRKYMRGYFELMNPYSAEYLAGVSAGEGATGARMLNGQVARMVDSDIRQIRGVVTDAFREASMTGMTALERGKEISRRFGNLIGDHELKSWAFIDAGGKRWKPGNYFAMVNRTAASNVQRRVFEDELVETGHDLVRLAGQIQSDSADACIAWVGRVFSLTGKTPGFPTPDVYIDAGGFHPNCVHWWEYISERNPSDKRIIDEQENEPWPEVETSKPKMESAE
jgi:hypothetical protein